MDARANFGYSLVAVAPSPALTGTALDVVSASAYPAVPFNASVWPAGELPLNSNAEIVRVTAIVGATLTIVRAQEGTTAKAIAIGYQFAATVTAKTITDIETEKAGVNGAITGGSITVNSSGVSVSLPAYLTTAALSGDTTKYAGVGESVGTVAGTDLGLTVNTDGVSIKHPNWLTTAQAVGAYLTTAALSGDSSKYAFTGFTTTTVAGDVVAGTHNTDGLKLAVPAYLTTAQPVGAYLTTAALSGDTTKYAGVGESVGTVAGTDLAMTVNTAGVSIDYPKWLTTAMASNLSSNFARTGFTTTTIAGSVVAGTHNTDGLLLAVPAYLTVAAGGGAGTGFTTTTVAGAVVAGTLSTDGLLLAVPAYLTTAGLSGDTTKYAGVGETVTTTAGTDLAMTVNTAGVNIAHPVWLTTAMASNRGSDFAGVGETVTTTAGTDLAMTVNTAGVNIAHPVWLTTAQAPGAYLTTAALSNHSHGNPTLNLTNLSGTTASASNGFTLSLSAAAPGGAATYSGHFVAHLLRDGTATSTGSLSQLALQPFTLHNNLSFGQIDFIGSATVVPTSAGNTWSARLTNSTQGHSYSAVYSITNGNLVDLYLFSRGPGVSSSELQTFASTRNSFITHYLATLGANATLTNTAGGSVRMSHTISMSISYPMLTSSTATSVHPASSYTAWGTGYTTWTSTASTNATATMSTSAAKTVSVGSTYPATANWSSWKMVPLNFGTSLTPGEYWLGMARYSTTSSSSTFGSSATGAAGTGNSYSVSYNASGSTQTAQITWVGNTNTIVSSLGFLGFASQASMAHLPGLGTMTGTYTGTQTYLNNMGNPAGAVAFSQINTGASMFQSWFIMDSNLP